MGAPREANMFRSEYYDPISHRLNCEPVAKADAVPGWDSVRQEKVGLRENGPGRLRCLLFRFVQTMKVSAGEEEAAYGAAFRYFCGQVQKT